MALMLRSGAVVKMPVSFVSFIIYTAHYTVNVTLNLTFTVHEAETETFHLFTLCNYTTGKRTIKLLSSRFLCHFDKSEVFSLVSETSK